MTQIIDATVDNIESIGMCGYKNSKGEGFFEKITWVKRQMSNGLEIKYLWDEKLKSQGFVEFIAAEKCWRPIYAPGYLFIHCLSVGPKKEFRSKGFGQKLIQSVIDSAKAQNKKGVAVLVRVGSFMADKRIFVQMDFVSCDCAEPDFELMVYAFDTAQDGEVYILNNQEILKNQYSDGLYLLRSDQCPYTVKNVREIADVAEKECDFPITIVDLTEHQQAQNNPSVFGSFALIYNGKVLSWHPISATRFTNIVKKIL